MSRQRYIQAASNIPGGSFVFEKLGLLFPVTNDDFEDDETLEVLGVAARNITAGDMCLFNEEGENTYHIISRAKCAVKTEFLPTLRVDDRVPCNMLIAVSNSNEAIFIIGNGENRNLKKGATDMENEEVKTQERMPEVGQSVVWHDSTGVAHQALVTEVWGAKCINLVVVSSDTTKTDTYGRQIERHTSQSHGSTNKVHGYYWRFEDEEPNPYVPPIAK